MAYPLPLALVPLTILSVSVQTAAPINSDSFLSSLLSQLSWTTIVFVKTKMTKSDFCHYCNTLKESFCHYWISGPANFDLGKHGSLAGLNFKMPVSRQG